MGRTILGPNDIRIVKMLQNKMNLKKGECYSVESQTTNDWIVYVCKAQRAYLPKSENGECYVAAVIDPLSGRFLIHSKDNNKDRFVKILKPSKYHLEVNRVFKIMGEDDSGRCWKVSDENGVSLLSKNEENYLYKMIIPDIVKKDSVSSKLPGSYPTVSSEEVRNATQDFCGLIIEERRPDNLSSTTLCHENDVSILKPIGEYLGLNSSLTREVISLNDRIPTTSTEMTLYSPYCCEL